MYSFSKCKFSNSNSKFKIQNSKFWNKPENSKSNQGLVDGLEFLGIMPTKRLSKFFDSLFCNIR